MLSLRGGYDYASRSPANLSHPPLASKTRRSPAPPRLLTVGASSVVLPNGRPAAAAVRCRVDSEDSPPSVIGLSGVDRRPAATTTTPPGVRHWSTSSSADSRLETTGSILKTSELHYDHDHDHHRHRDGRVGVSGRPRRVRFTDDVSLRRFDSGGDDVDSAYSSAECDPRLYAAPSARRSGPPGGRHLKTTTVSVPGSNSRWNNNGTYRDDDRYDRMQSSSVARIQIPVYPLGMKQPRGVHISPNGNLDKTRSTPSLHWPSRTSPPSPPLHRQGPSVVGLSSSGALKTANHIVIGDPVTRKNKLIVAAKLSGSFLPDDVTVKANKNGNRIRVTSTPTTPHHRQHGGAASWWHQGLNEQILLPVRVDPYRLTARIDTNGDLIIEAPCVL